MGKYAIILEKTPNMHNPDTPQQRLLRRWRSLSALPGGKWLFSRLLGWMVPYSGNLGASIRVLEPGHCLLRIHDRRALRNHLRSIHALALANAGELCSGLALYTQLPPRLRGIPVELCTRYVQKARGSLLAEGRVLDALPEQEGDVCVEGCITDDQGQTVAITQVRWRISPLSDGRS